jgi:hypothetical protein
VGRGRHRPQPAHHALDARADRGPPFRGGPMTATVAGAGRRILVLSCMSLVSLAGCSADGDGDQVPQTTIDALSDGGGGAERRRSQRLVSMARREPRATTASTATASRRPPACAAAGRAQTAAALANSAATSR